MSARCPICQKTTQAEYRPFCSKRCADVDLHRWLSQSYVVAGPSVELTDESDSDAAPSSSSLQDDSDEASSAP